MTYCSQSVTGHIHGKEPYCRSLCVRKVFPHEVCNVIAFKQHKQVDQSGKAAYPLPTEGQLANLPHILGGEPPEDDSNHKPQLRHNSKNWDKGLYLWTGKGPMAAHQKINSMSLDFEHQRQFVEMRQRRREMWQDYQDSLRQKNDAGKEDVRTWVPNVPPRPLPDTRCASPVFLDVGQVMNLWCCSFQSLLVPYLPVPCPFGRGSISYWPLLLMSSVYWETASSQGNRGSSLNVSGRWPDRMSRLYLQVVRSIKPTNFGRRMTRQLMKTIRRISFDASKPLKIRRIPAVCTEPSHCHLILILEIFLCYQCIMILVHSILVCCIDSYTNNIVQHSKFFPGCKVLKTWGRKKVIVATTGDVTVKKLSDSFYERPWKHDLCFTTT